MAVARLEKGFYLCRSRRVCLRNLMSLFLAFIWSRAIGNPEFYVGVDCSLLSLFFFLNFILENDRVYVFFFSSFSLTFLSCKMYAYLGCQSEMVLLVKGGWKEMFCS